MKTPLFLLVLTATFLSACNENKKDDKKFISVPSFISNQIADVDTSLYSIIKLDYIDSTRTDTTHIRREDFRSLAKDFLDIPDISDKKNRSNYKEETRFDENLNSVVISYLPENPEKALVQRQELLVKPDPTGDKVRTIIIDYLLSNRDSSVQKRMLWQIDKSFLVTTIRQKPGQPETVSTTKVIWNDFDDQ